MSPLELLAKANKLNAERRERLYQQQLSQAYASIEWGSKASVDAYNEYAQQLKRELEVRA